MQEWKPIETCPRDGTWFMICREDEGYDSYEIGKYDPMPWYDYEPVDGTALYERKERTICEWRGFNNIHRATHWSPLQPPPKSEKQ